ncbi:MAG: acetyl-CoA acetyltransferase [Deltaproteobacteria bacterium]|nr:acetyl-CoA acetyltransferase [Deltaproteobacteria bacterium]
MMPGRRVAIAGVGYSTIGRHTGLSSDELVRQSTLAALDDAGLRMADIDGLATVGSDALSNAWMMGIAPLHWWNSTLQAPAFVYAAHQAISAIASGFCETALALRIIQQQPTGKKLLSGGGKSNPMTAGLTHAGGDRQFLVPFGAGSPVNFAGLLTQRHVSQYGTTEEHFGHHVIAQREHASLNEDAFFRDRLTMEEYLASRYVSKPVRLLDCDYPCDSGSAVIFTTEERARDLDKPAVLVEAASLVATRDIQFEILENMVETSPHVCAKEIWARTELGPDDVDTAHLYDGFSIIPFQWLEAFGFCGPGEAGPFIAEGNTRRGGRLPMNTDGGACNVGRRHGANFCIESVRQLRGECGERQVEGAEVSVFTNSFGPFCGAVLLTRG